MLSVALLNIIIMNIVALLQTSYNHYLTKNQTNMIVTKLLTIFLRTILSKDALSTKCLPKMSWAFL
jgi:hypothetical protein